MKLGNLESIFNDGNNLYDVINENLKPQTYLEGKKPKKLSRILTTLSHYGMKIDDKVYKNMRAIPADDALQQKDDALLQATLWGAGANNWKIKPEEEKSFSEKSLTQKFEILRKMAMQPELEDILDMMANESIVYDDDESYICEPFLDSALIQDLNEKSAEEIRTSMNTQFYKLYLLLDWKKHAWDIYKRYLIEGVLAYQIVYDDVENPHTIIDIVDVDPNTLTRSIEDGVVYWIQFKDVIGRERKLLDAEIIYIKYEDSGVAPRQSYLERLIRPFNLYRIVEQAQVIWTVTQSSFKTMFTIPVGGMNRAKGAQTLAAAMNRYKEDISFNVETGELQVNGRVNMPFNKEYWLPQNEAGKPEIETLVDNGPQLNDSDQIKYFEYKLYKMSKIPATRFDKDAQSTWFGNDPTQALRDEINFSRFVNRLRNNFAEILLKPLRISVALAMPDIKNDKRILDAMSLHFNSYNLFEEMMNLEIMQKRIDFIGTFKDSITETDADGNEKPFFSLKFLVMRYLKMTDADLELNEKYRLEAELVKKNKKKKEEDEGEKEKEGGNEDESESDESEDIDSEMLGDVQPESSETAQA
jgi:hypothetical protein